jgi:hypothetical protein
MTPAVVQLLLGDGAPWAGRMVLAPCEAYDNFPPGLTGKALALTSKLPPRVFGMFMQQCGFGLSGGSPSRSGGSPCEEMRPPHGG